MAFYIGNSPSDTNFLLGGEKTERTLWNASSHVWPRYYFSWFDGTMEKFVDGISCRGQVVKEPLRSCETSWWHRLDFVEDVQYNISETDKDWLIYDAFERIGGKPGMLSAEFFHTSENSDRIPSVVYGVNYVECLFDESYKDVEGGKIKNPTCDKNIADCTPQFNIPANIWFKERGAKITYRQRWEWQDEVRSASPNRPSITIKQNANRLKTGTANDIVIELVSCSPQNASSSPTSVSIKFKIYAMTEATDQPIYYGDNILSNFGTADAYGEIYRTGYMWLTSTGDMTLDSAATYDASTKTWSINGHWSSNAPSATSDAHDFHISKVEDTLKEGEAAAYIVSASCGAASSTRYATFTINLGAKNNWINKSLQGPRLSQAGESVSYPCSVKYTSDPDEDKYWVSSIRVAFSAITPGQPTYVFAKDKSSVAGGETITVNSYKSTEAQSSSESVEIVAKCSATGHTGTVTVTCEQSASGSKESVGFTVKCVGCIADLSISETDHENGIWSIAVSDEHSHDGSTGTINLTQNESGNPLSVEHTASGSPADYTYSIKYYSDSSCRNPISKVDLPAAGGSVTVYVQAVETKTQNGSVETHIVNETDTEAKPSDISISFSGNENISESVGSFSNDRFPVTFTAGVNSESSFNDLAIVKDTDFNATLGNTANSSTTFKFHLEGGAGITRQGTDGASIRGASASCSVEQKSTVTGGVKDMADHSSDIGLTTTSTPSGEESAVDVSMAFSGGDYTVTIKAKNDYKATTSAGKVPYATTGHAATLTNQKIYSAKNTVEQAGSTGTVDINAGNEYGYFSSSGNDKVLFTLSIPNVYGGNYGGVDNRIQRTFGVTAAAKSGVTNIVGSAQSTTTQTAQELWSGATDYTDVPTGYSVEWSDSGTYISGVSASAGATNATAQLSSADIADLKTKGVEAGTSVGSVTATVKEGTSTVGSLTWSWTFVKAEKPADPKVHVYWKDNLTRDDETLKSWEGDPGDAPKSSDWPSNPSPGSTSQGLETGVNWGNFVGWFDSNGNQVTSIDSVTEDTTLYAKYWLEVEWTLNMSFDGVWDFVYGLDNNFQGSLWATSDNPKYMIGGPFTVMYYAYPSSVTVLYNANDPTRQTVAEFYGGTDSGQPLWNSTTITDDGRKTTNVRHSIGEGSHYTKYISDYSPNAINYSNYSWSDPVTTSIINPGNYIKYADTGKWGQVVTHL